MKDVVCRNIIITEGKGFMEVEESRENGNEEEDKGERKRLKKRQHIHPQAKSYSYLRCRLWIFH